MKTFYVVMTLNGNLVLKDETKIRDNDEVEIELYCETLEEAKKEFKEHKKMLKKEGLI